jgi:bilirubin oxidase
MGEGIDYAATNLIMRIAVGTKVTDDTNNGDVPPILRYIEPPPEDKEPAKKFTFEHDKNDSWVINGVGFADVENRILARPERGGDEIWELKNGDGKGTHPVHIHLVDFMVLERTGGRNEVFPYEGAGMKDVIWLGAGETIRVLARYAPWNGV